MSDELANESRSSTTPLRVAELRELRTSGAMHALIDVRELPETDAGHIPGASTVPLRTLPIRLEELFPSPAVEVIVVDDGGDDRRAAAAVAILARAGVSSPKALEGGLAAWVAEGGRVERGRNVPSKRFGESLVEPDQDLMVAPETLAVWMADGRVDRILDVRTASEHHRECIPGSQHAGGFDVVAAARMRQDPSRPLIVHCTGRTRGLVAAATLRMLGMPNVYALENGTMGWKLAGLELEHEAARPAPSRPASDRVDESGSSARIDLAWQSAEDVGVRRVAARVADERLRVQAHPTQLIDVRTPAEFAAASPELAFSVPSGQLVQQLDDHVVTVGAHVILIDDGGIRAPIAAYWLRRIGVADVSVVEGGVAGWEAAGLPLVSASDRLAPRLVAVAERVIEGSSPSEVEALLEGGAAEGGAAVVSVAPSTEHSVGHLPDAGWMQASRVIEDPLATARTLPSGPVVLTCTDGQSSAYLAALLVAQGRDDVRWLHGGVDAWRASGRPVATGQDAVPTPAPDAIEHPIHVGAAAMQAYLDWELDLEHDPTDTV